MSLKSRKIIPLAMREGHCTVLELVIPLTSCKIPLLVFLETCAVTSKIGTESTVQQHQLFAHDSDL